MIERIEIETYRGIRKADLPGLAPLTVFVGPNNSGKSSVLEALYLAGSRGVSGEPLNKVGLRRGWIGLGSLLSWIPGASLFRVIDDGQPFQMRIKLGPTRGKQIEVLFGVEGYHETHATFGEDGGQGYSTLIREPIHALPVLIEPTKEDPGSVAMDEAVSRAEQAGQLDQLIELLRPILPALKDLRILKTGDRYALYVGEDNGPSWPAIAAGDGFKKLLLLAGDIAADKSGLILIEEPETHLHVGALNLISKMLWQAVKAEKPKQVFITTHSLELIDALFGAESADLDRAVVYRLSLQKGELKGVRVPGATVRELRAEISEDLRR